MTRAHTVAAPKHHVVSGGKAWDTVKPLHRWFSDVSRVIIVDDDAYKVWVLASLYQSAAYHMGVALTAHLSVKLSHTKKMIANLGPL